MKEKVFYMPCKLSECTCGEKVIGRYVVAKNKRSAKRLLKLEDPQPNGIPTAQNNTWFCVHCLGEKIAINVNDN